MKADRFAAPISPKSIWAKLIAGSVAVHLPAAGASGSRAKGTPGN
jgi:hypothetical protein